MPLFMRDSLDTYSEKHTHKYNNQILGQILETIRDDCATQKEYNEIFSIIPECCVVERQPLSWSEEMFGFQRYYTKRKLNTDINLDIIDKLKLFAQQNQINWNRLCFKIDWNNCFIHTIYRND
jgi:hypothetical protein